MKRLEYSLIAALFVILGLILLIGKADAQSHTPCVKGCHVKLHASRKAETWVSPEIFSSAQLPHFSSIGIRPTLSKPTGHIGMRGTQIDNCHLEFTGDGIVLHISTCGDPAHLVARYVALAKPRPFYISYRAMP